MRESVRGCMRVGGSKGGRVDARNGAGELNGGGFPGPGFLQEGWRKAGRQKGEKENERDRSQSFNDYPLAHSI